MPKVENTVCDCCGSAFYKRPSALLRSNTNCCSRKCSAKLRSEWMKGAGNHQYGLEGELNASYLSDVRVSTYGYTLLRNLTHPLRNVDNMLFAHRLVVEEVLKADAPGSPYLIDVDGQQVLSPEYDVHHIDGNRLNNSSINLEIVTRASHTARHNQDNIIERNEDGTFRSIRATKTSGTLSRKHKFDAGADVHSNESCIIRAGERRLVSTGLRINVPHGSVGLLWSRSGLSAKHGIEVGAGCIDSEYIGEVKVNLYNHSSQAYRVESGDRIAQLLTVPLDLSVYEDTDDIVDTKRGEGGHGSTGV